MDAPAPPNSDNSDASRHVSALVVTRRPGDVDDVVSAIEAQVYEAKSISVISAANAHSNIGPGIKSFASVADALGALSAKVAFVWIVDQDARPRPDALAALVSTADQIDASVVGSKILRADAPEELISVGEATDIFGHPYSGLEAGERDQEQYDVIRDVAYVESASMLVRRDLAIGLGGLDPLVPYLASGLDFCQRARLAGGRVVVAPTSEVLYEGFRGDRSSTWREQAGRIRSMLKVYEAVTLLWAIPTLLLIGLVTAIYWSFNARPFALVDWGRAWLWNVLHFGSTLTERARARRSRQAGDAELFRYQIRGSVEMNGLAAQFGSIIQDDADDDEQDLDQLFSQSSAVWHRPGLVASTVGVAYVAVLTRSLWSDGMPSVGFTLPLADHAYDVLRAYAGGWNLGGLGSGQPMPPAVGATAIVQFVTRSSAPLAATAMTIGAATLAIGGTVRLLRRLGIGQIPRYAASIIVVAGPAATVIGSLGYWPALLAMGTLPWALAAVLEPFPAGWRSRLGRLARIALAVAWAAAMVPPLVLLPAIFGLIWAVARRDLGPAGRGLLVSGLGVPFLFPWLAAVDLSSIFTGGEPIRFDMSWVSIVGILVAGSAVLTSATGAALRTGGLGAILAALGAFAARSGSLGSGLDLTVAGGVTAGIGFALIVGAALDGKKASENAGAVRSSIVTLGIVGAALALLFTFGLLPEGRAGLPADDYGSSLAFASSRADPHGPDRLLLVGPADQLPGEVYRLEDGTAYRLVSGPVPTFAQAWLPEPKLGDQALASALNRLAEDVELRPGESMVPFGVRWIVFTDPEMGGTAGVILDRSLRSQLDLRPLQQLDATVFETEMPAPRAVTDDGKPWTYGLADYQGEAQQGTVLIKENADSRWGPGTWSQDQWSNRVDASDGFVEFGGVGVFRLMARLVGALLLMVVLLALWGRQPVERRDQ